jgi:hypothetical protein
VPGRAPGRPGSQVDRTPPQLRDGHPVIDRIWIVESVKGKIRLGEDALAQPGAEDGHRIHRANVARGHIQSWQQSARHRPLLGLGHIQPRIRDPKPRVGAKGVLDRLREAEGAHLIGRDSLGAELLR